MAIKKKLSEFGHHRPSMRDVARRLAELHMHVIEQGKLLARVSIITREIQRRQGDPGLSREDTAEVIATFGRSIDRLRRVANDPDNPDPGAGLPIRKKAGSMATAAEQKAALLAQAKTLDDITTNIAADIVRLKGRISTGMTEADVAEVTAGFDGVASRLTAVATDPDNPDPEAPPATV
jgi:hypothetical protein